MTVGAQREVVSGQHQKERNPGQVRIDTGRFGLAMVFTAEISAGGRQDEGSRAFEAAGDVTRGEDAEVSDLHEAFWEQVLEESPDESCRRAIPP